MKILSSNPLNFQFRLFITVILSISICPSVLGQEMIEATIYVSPEDSMKGFIQYEKIVDLSDGIEFCEKMGDKPRFISPNYIHGFKYENLLFRSLCLYTGDKKSCLFALAIVESKLSLYSVDNSFYSIKDGFVEQLDKPKAVKKGNKIYEQQVDIQQFNRLFAECNNRHELIKAIKYDIKSLKQAFLSYNECVDNEITYSHYIEKAETRGGLLVYGGIGNSNYPMYDLGGYIKYAPNNMGGLKYFRQVLGRTENNRRLIGQFEFGFEVNSISEIARTASFISGAVLLQHAFTNPRLKSYLYAEAGLQTNIKVSTTGDLYAWKRNLGVGIPVGLGLQPSWGKNSKNRIGFGLRYLRIKDLPFIHQDFKAFFRLNI
ncbi:hypothetical protein [Jiulongibacter sp. NS-SX5]|uniref:hypothetical protein n=1 Tax=Jiulongibacter sp. NS-SX5 TaxID=3463854 RepID=UPI004059EE69